MSDDDYAPDDVDYEEPVVDDPETDAADEPEDSDENATDGSDGDDDNTKNDAVPASDMDETEEKNSRVRGLPATADRRKPDASVAAATVSRKIVIIAPNDRRTSDVVQPAEAAHLIAMRAAQIAEHAVYFVDAKNLHDPVSIAYLEFISRRNPLIIRRQIGTIDGANYVEEWFPNEMVHSQIAAPPGMKRG